MILAIGDIHGQRDKLRALLAQLPLDEAGELVFLGDYIDRGSDTPGVIDDLISLREKHPQVIFLRGNHEQMMLQARANDDLRWGLTFGILPDDDELWKQNGAAQTVYQYRQRNGSGPWYDVVDQAHWTFLIETQLEVTLGSYRFVHAGFLPAGVRWPYNHLDPRLWVREPFLNSSCDFGEVVVYGHTVQASGLPNVEKNKIGIDTGAAYGGPLTAIGLPEPFDRDKIAIWQA